MPRTMRRSERPRELREMSNKAKVLKQHPKAGSQHLRGIPGAPAPYDKDHWRIYREDGEIAETIGTGLTEKDAWADAANKLSTRR